MERYLHKDTDNCGRPTLNTLQGGKDVHLPAIYSLLLAEYSYQK
jgi:hypothetical protein